MKRSLKFLTLSFLILLAQSSLAAKYEAGTGSVAHSEQSVAIGESYYIYENGVPKEIKNEAGNPENPTEKYYATAVGIANKASTGDSSAIGLRNTASSGNSSAFGSQNRASEVQSSAFGYRNRASGAFSSAFGSRNRASGVGSSAFGFGNEASEESSSAFGSQNRASGVESSAFGNGTYVSGEGSGAFGRGAWDRSLNGGAGDYAYKIEGNNSWAIGSFNRIAAGSDNNHILGNNVSIGAEINNSVALGNNSAVSSSNEVSVGSATLKRKITNVADGEVSATSTDAVNGRQLYNAMQNNLGLENLKSELKSEINHVGSLSAALSALHPMQYDPQAPNQIMAGFGHYRNKQSVAVGMSHYFSDNVLMTAGVAIGSERRVKTMANVGLTWKIGKGGSSSATNAPQYIVQDELARLTRENKAQAKENSELRAQLNSQAKEIEIMKQQLNSLLKKK